MPESRIETKDLVIGYDAGRHRRTVIARDINVQLNPGELVCLIGPNGAGKSTLMRTLAAMQSPLDGKVLLDGIDIHHMNSGDRARMLSVVLTEKVTVGLLDAYSLVSLGRYPYTGWSGKLTNADHEVVEWALKSVNAEEFAQRQVLELSDGERQRVMLARALAQEPRLMVLDEITAFLDLPRRVDIMRTLRRLVRETRRAILLSTHDLELALRSADRIWLLQKGGPLQVGAPERLVLNGAFERAFQSEGVDFDASTGTFRLHRDHAGEIEVQGDSLHAIWTARALERYGYRPRSSGVACQLRVVVAPDGSRFTLIHNGSRDEHESLEDLLAALCPASRSS
jgi:iron complex transport system ATP-binding protein